MNSWQITWWWRSTVVALTCGVAATWQPVWAHSQFNTIPGIIHMYISLHNIYIYMHDICTCVYFYIHRSCICLKIWHDLTLLPYWKECINLFPSEPPKKDIWISLDIWRFMTGFSGFKFHPWKHVKFHPLVAPSTPTNSPRCKALRHVWSVWETGYITLAKWRAP